MTKYYEKKIIEFYNIIVNLGTKEKDNKPRDEKWLKEYYEARNAFGIDTLKCLDLLERKGL